MRCNVNGLLQELLNVNEENLREILEHDWLIDWVERAREETATYGFFQAFWFQLFIVHSFFSSPSSCRPPAQPGFEGHLHHPSQLLIAGGPTLTNTTWCKFNQVDVQAPGRRGRPRMEALQYLGIIQVSSFLQFQSRFTCFPGDVWRDG